MTPRLVRLAISSAQTAPAVAEICARLDGLPLAIELAAADQGAVTAGHAGPADERAAPRGPRAKR